MQTNGLENKKEASFVIELQKGGDVFEFQVNSNGITVNCATY